MDKKNTNRTPRNGLIAALDLGTTKITCFIARPGGREGAKIIGVGHQISRGLRAGSIVEMDAAEAAIRAVVEDAERMAGDNVSSVVVSLSGGAPASRLVSYEFALGGHEIGDAELCRALDPAWLAGQQGAERQIVHAIPLAYQVDENSGIRDPCGMFGGKLGVNMHVMTVASGARRNLAACLGRCLLDVEAQVVAPYASGLACLVEDERKLGATCIDMGGGTTTLSVFFDREVVHTDCVPLGGDHVTRDIARGLSAPLAYAERIKTLYGSAIPSPSDDQDFLTVPLVGEEANAEANRIPRSVLVGIIRPRIEEILEMVRARLEITGLESVMGRRVVLTGGASQLTGVRELAGAVLDKQVRLGRPQRIGGLPEAADGPAFATCAGLVRFAVRHRAEALARPQRNSNRRTGHLARLGSWIRENVLPSLSPLRGG